MHQQEESRKSKLFGSEFLCFNVLSLSLSIKDDQKRLRFGVSSSDSIFQSFRMFLDPFRPWKTWNCWGVWGRSGGRVVVFDLFNHYGCTLQSAIFGRLEGVIICPRLEEMKLDAQNVGCFDWFPTSKIVPLFFWEGWSHISWPLIFFLQNSEVCFSDSSPPPKKKINIFAGWAFQGEFRDPAECLPDFFLDDSRPGLMQAGNHRRAWQCVEELPLVQSLRRKAGVGWLDSNSVGMFFRCNFLFLVSFCLHPDL